jgi:hypothetical protein
MVKIPIIKNKVTTESPEFQCIEVKKHKSFCVTKIRIRKNCFSKTSVGYFPIN